MPQLQMQNFIQWIFSNCKSGLWWQKYKKYLWTRKEITKYDKAVWIISVVRDLTHNLIHLLTPSHNPLLYIRSHSHKHWPTHAHSWTYCVSHEDVRSSHTRHMFPHTVKPPAADSLFICLFAPHVKKKHHHPNVRSGWEEWVSET